MNSIGYLAYQKYEKFSNQYIISIQQIEDFIAEITKECTDFTELELNQQLDSMISSNCYYNLTTNKLDDFNNKLKHNIELAKFNLDQKYINYLSIKFNITDDLFNVDTNVWSYQPKKILIKLKCLPNSQLKSKLNIPNQLKVLISNNNNIEITQFHELVRLIHKYIYDNNLQNKTNKSVINLDDHLKAILPPLDSNDINYTYYNLPKYIKTLTQ